MFELKHKINKTFSSTCSNRCLRGARYIAAIVLLITSQQAVAVGSLQITKFVTGGPTGGIFTVDLDCDVNQFDQTGISLNHGVPHVIANIADGTQCSVTENSKPTAPTGFVFDTEEISAPVTISAGTIQVINVTNPLIQRGSIVIALDAAPDSAQEFLFSTGNLSPVSFSLSDAGSGSGNQRVFSNIQTGSYQIVQSAVQGWTLSNIHCRGAIDSHIEIEKASRAVTINLSGNEQVLCVFTNFEGVEGGCPHGTDIPNQVQIYANEPESNYANNASQVCKATLTTDLSLDLSVDTPHPIAGDTVTFTIDLINQSEVAATGVTVENVVPSGYRDFELPVDDSLDIEIDNNDTIRWKYLTIPARSTRTVSFTAIVNEQGDFENWAEIIAADQPDFDSNPETGHLIDDANSGDGNTNDDDEDFATTKPGELVCIGDEVEFTIEVRNTSSVHASNVAVSDVVPAGFNNLNTISSSGVLNGNQIDWTGLDIGAGDHVALTFKATADSGSLLVNSAEISAVDQADSDSRPDNDNNGEDDQDSALVIVSEEVDVYLGEDDAPRCLTQSGQVLGVNNCTPPVGDVVTYTVLLSNHGPCDATGVKVDDALPELGFGEVDQISHFGTVNDLLVQWDNLTIPANESLSLTFDSRVKANGEPKDYDHCAVYKGSEENDLDAQNNQACLQIEPEERIELTLEKRVSDVQPYLGDTVLMTTEIKNIGETDYTNHATGVEIEVLVPSGYRLIPGSLDPSVGVYDATSATITWSNVDVSVGDDVRLTYEAEIIVADTVIDPKAYQACAEVNAADQTDRSSTVDNMINGGLLTRDPNEADEACVITNPIMVGRVSGRILTTADNEQTSDEVLSRQRIPLRLYRDLNGDDRITEADHDANSELINVYDQSIPTQNNASTSVDNQVTYSLGENVSLLKVDYGLKQIHQGRGHYAVYARANQPVTGLQTYLYSAQVSLVLPVALSSKATLLKGQDTINDESAQNFKWDWSLNSSNGSDGPGDAGQIEHPQNRIVSIAQKNIGAQISFSSAGQEIKLFEFYINPGQCQSGDLIRLVNNINDPDNRADAITKIPNSVATSASNSWSAFGGRLYGNNYYSNGNDLGLPCIGESPDLPQAGEATKGSRQAQALTANVNYVSTISRRRLDVSIEQAPNQDDPSANGIAEFHIAFSEPIREATFTASDLNLSGTSAATLSEPIAILEPGFDLTYKVTVEGMLEGETAMLSLPANKVEIADYILTDTDGRYEFRRVLINTPIEFGAGLNPPVTNNNFVIVKMPDPLFTDLSENEGGHDQDGDNNEADNLQIAGEFSVFGERDAGNDFRDGQIDLELDWVSSIDQCPVGAQQYQANTYTLTVKNVGVTVAENVEVKALVGQINDDSLLNPFAYFPISQDAINLGGHYDVETRVITWVLPVVTSTPIELQFSAQVLRTGSITNIAQVSQSVIVDIDSTPSQDFILTPIATEDDEDSIVCVIDPAEADVVGEVEYSKLISNADDRLEWVRQTIVVDAVVKLYRDERGDGEIDLRDLNNDGVADTLYSIAATDELGRYEFLDVPIGQYVLESKPLFNFNTGRENEGGSDGAQDWPVLGRICQRYAQYECAQGNGPATFCAYAAQVCKGDFDIDPKFGSLSVTKNVVGSIDAATEYEIQIECNNDDYDALIELQNGETHTIDNILVDTVCNISEPNLPTPPTDFVWATPTVAPPSDIVIGIDTLQAVTITNTLVVDSRGDLQITAQLQGSNSQLDFTLSLDCSDDTFDDAALVIGSGLTTTISDIPSGTSCSVSSSNLPNPPVGLYWDRPQVKPEEAVQIVAAGVKALVVLYQLYPVPMTREMCQAAFVSPISTFSSGYITAGNNFALNSSVPPFTPSFYAGEGCSGPCQAQAGSITPLNLSSLPLPTQASTDWRETHAGSYQLPSSDAPANLEFSSLLVDNIGSNLTIADGSVVKVAGRFEVKNGAHLLLEDNVTIYADVIKFERANSLELQGNGRATLVANTFEFSSNFSVKNVTDPSKLLVISTGNINGINNSVYNNVSLLAYMYAGGDVTFDNNQYFRGSMAGSVVSFGNNAQILYNSTDTANFCLSLPSGVGSGSDIHNNRTGQIGTDNARNNINASIETAVTNGSEQVNNFCDFSLSDPSECSTYLNDDWIVGRPDNRISVILRHDELNGVDDLNNFTWKQIAASEQTETGLRLAVVGNGVNDDLIDIINGLAGSGSGATTGTNYERLIDLEIDKKAVPSEGVRPGDSVTFMVELSNTSERTATGVQLVDRVPSGYRVVGRVSHNGQAESGNIVWSNLRVEAGETKTIVYEAVLTDSADYLNLVEVTAADQQDIDSIPDNGVDTNHNGVVMDDPGDEDDGDGVEINPLKEVDLSLVIDSLPSVKAHERINLVVSLLNKGPDAASGVDVVLHLPERAEVLDVQSESGIVSDDGLLWHWADLSVQADQRRQLSVSLVVPESGQLNMFVEIEAADQEDQDSTPSNRDSDEDDLLIIELNDHRP